MYNCNGTCTKRTTLEMGREEKEIGMMARFTAKVVSGAAPVAIVGVGYDWDGDEEC